MTTLAPNDVTAVHRSHLVTVRETIRAAADGRDCADLLTAAAMLSRVSDTSDHIRTYFASFLEDARRMIASPVLSTDALRHAMNAIDLVLDETCMHAPAMWLVMDAGPDLYWITCPGCQASWTSDGAGVPSERRIRI